MLISESVLSPTHFLLNSQRNFSLLLHIPLQTQACLTYFLLVLFSRMLLLVSYIFPELHFQRQTLQFPLFLGTIWVSCQDEINFPSLLSLCFREKNHFLSQSLLHYLSQAVILQSLMCVYLLHDSQSLSQRSEQYFIHLSFTALTYSNVWHMCWLM